MRPGASAATRAPFKNPSVSATDVSDGLTRLSPSARTTLQVVSVALIVAGLALVATGFYSFGSGNGPFSGPGMDGPGSGFFAFAAGGFLTVLGFALARFAFLKVVSEVVVTETGGAMEYGTSRAGHGLGRGLKESGVLSGLGGRDVVKLRCRSCGAVDDEHAKFCSACGKPM